ncbi:hypothetical protein E5Q_03690 [Mixia osmundae IAM 14324]|uniref:Major facilitator superfamily (MFS) profile domain-containing protein n=1 Tax=Mixia osmundae (strain CBS 9802 / IAM 14324 / JCM 22182 / KY 12970) TaxID=764103 RepID=G7E2F6_MIXOS|nr:hypothetical protein E5Q_03690 [Mixia osmundae IAM 14324]
MPPFSLKPRRKAVRRLFESSADLCYSSKGGSLTYDGIKGNAQHTTGLDRDSLMNCASLPKPLSAIRQQYMKTYQDAQAIGAKSLHRAATGPDDLDPLIPSYDTDAPLLMKQSKMASERFDGSADPSIALRGPQLTAEEKNEIADRENPANYSDIGLLRDSIAPLDSYTEDGVYWADLPARQRNAWITRTEGAESRREFGVVWAMFKKDPLEPIRQYFARYVATGMGLFVEGFTLFSIGNLSALFSAVWPTCWSTHTVCAANWVYGVNYLEIVGIIIGQILVGIEGDWIGRKFGMMQDAVIMAIGTLMLIASWGTSLQGWVICYAFSLLFYGIGVGGEYPMTSTRSMEGVGSGRNATTADKAHRGRTVVLAFLMQGWGQFINQAALIILLLIFNGGGNPPYSKKTAQWTFRLSFVVVLPFTLWLVYYRYYKVTYADAALKRSRQRLGTSGYDVASLNLALRYFWPRLLATTIGWFANDFAFYGNKIFTSEFIKVISPQSKSVVTSWNWSLLNIGVSLVGYYLAAFFIDAKHYGRVRMQLVGFLADFVCFVIPAFAYKTLTKPGSGIKGFQALFFLSSFFQQFGPNCVTFLVAAEVYPASIRATAHGVSAAAGKLGALAPTILYNYIDAETRFKVVPWFALFGAIATFLFLPDVTGLDLREQERAWEYLRTEREYHGVAIHPRHLSIWEIYVQKRHRHYNPALDRQEKIDELRDLYKGYTRSKAMEKDAESEDGVEADDYSFVSDDVVAYFSKEKGSLAPKASPGSDETNVAFHNEKQS